MNDDDTALVTWLRGISPVRLSVIASLVTIVLTAVLVLLNQFAPPSPRLRNDLFGFLAFASLIACVAGIRALWLTQNRPYASAGIGFLWFIASVPLLGMLPQSVGD